MVCVAEMPDSTLSFKLKIPFLQWATHAAIPLHSIFPAAKKALREGLQAVSLHTTSQPSLYDQARGPAGMEFWLKVRLQQMRLNEGTFGGNTWVAHRESGLATSVEIG